MPFLDPLLWLRHGARDGQRLGGRLRLRCRLHRLAEGSGGMFGLVHREVLLKLAIGEGLACQLGISAQVANEDVHDPRAEALGHAAPEAQDHDRVVRRSATGVFRWPGPGNLKCTIWSYTSE